MEMNAAAVQVVAEAEAAVDASVAAFAAVLAGGTAVSGADSVGGSDPAVGCVDDPLQRVVDGALDVLAGVARSEAKLAALKARAVQVLAAATSLLNGPPSSPQEATAQDRSLVAEVGCALVIGDRAAGALLAESHALATSRPRALAALQSGTISWAHARAMVGQTLGLDPAAAAALEDHFLDPEAYPVRGAGIGEMPAYRFRARARTWRERHHPESLEKRHAKGVADPRVGCTPDQDGMAWLSAYLPAHQAMAGWNRLNAPARGMQGPDETRTLAHIPGQRDRRSDPHQGTSPSFRASNSLATVVVPSPGVHSCNAARTVRSRAGSSQSRPASRAHRSGPSSEDRHGDQDLRPDRRRKGGIRTCARPITDACAVTGKVCLVGEVQGA